ncbi:MAG: sigma-54-dependent Fis family transcriptional regulator [Deltaproteobacteria bacterium]|nr:sigma-54-dependent Fis family transcriptional regulator [Deltaproteobacteria bacterium]
MSKILIIDDDKMICKTLARNIQRMGHESTSVFTLEDGLEAVQYGAFDVVFLDVRLPDGNGLDALPMMQKADSSPEIVIITGEGDPDGAQLAIETGAWAYVQKPFNMEDLSLQLSRALQYHEKKFPTKSLTILRREGIVGSSPELEACLDLVAQMANSDLNVLITGETGTGKELFAKTVHRNSARSTKNFVVLDCASLPENLVGSMLFGHEKGAFTGAEKPRVGFMKEADGGTLFLDEVGELPLTIQKDFLRALQEHRFRPLGGNKEIESDFRLLSATNRDLGSMVQSGNFRKDLYFRIQAVTIDLPPLRIRPGDIKEIALYYITKLCERYGTETKGISPDFFDALTLYDWPGNVRELLNTMERVLAVARLEPTLFPRHLPTELRVQQARASVGKPGTEEEIYSKEGSQVLMLPKLQTVRDAALTNAEKQYLHDLMLLTKRSIKEACRISGLSQSRLYSLLRKYNINKF